MRAAIESFMMFTTGVHLRYVNDPIVVSHRIKIFVDSRLLCWLLTTTERFGSSEFSYWTIRQSGDKRDWYHTYDLIAMYANRLI